MFALTAYIYNQWTTVYTCGVYTVLYYILQRQDKYTDNKLKALKARNEYLLSIEAANAATNKYFVDDLSLLIDVSISRGSCVEVFDL